ncbi:MAG: 1-phosphofructokinase, partial [Clostridia bacterium]|nr:1-phosphofructokinase [Clostridia bacterium]
MITTISLNPSIDRTLPVEHFVPGGLNRVVSKSDVAAGKGINVALTVAGLGLDAECIGFMYDEGTSLFEKRLMLN